RAEFDHAASCCSLDHARGLAGDQDGKRNRGQEAGLYDLGFDDRRRYSQQRLLREHGRAFRDSPDLACKAQIAQVLEKSVADGLEYFVGAKELDLLRTEVEVFQEIQRLLQPGGNQVAAIFRQRADEQFEAGRGIEAALKVSGRHGEFVQVG